MSEMRHLLENIDGEPKQRITWVFHAFAVPVEGYFYHSIRRIVFNFLNDWSRHLAKEGIVFGNGLLATFHLIIFEAIKNASDHGSDCDPEKDIKLTLWTGNKGILVGVKDEGTFYKNEETKKRVEGKHSSPVVWKQRHVKNCGIGMGIIYQADELFVDTEEGILYLLLLFDHKIWEGVEK